jgi:hypothetical protein
MQLLNISLLLKSNKIQFFKKHIKPECIVYVINVHQVMKMKNNTAVSVSLSV